MQTPRRYAPMGGSFAPVRVAGFTWNGWQASAVYARLAQLGHLQGHFAGLGVEFTLIVTGAGIDAIRAAFVALGPAHGVGFGIQHRIQRLLNSAADQLTKMVLNPGIIDLNDFTQARALVIVAHGGVSPLLWD
jgi:hypothetical protein